MTFAEAAEYILKQAGVPLHFREITARAVDQGLIQVQGNTPWNSMNGTLRRLIRQRGEDAPFVALGDGRFALREWPLDDLPPQPRPAGGTQEMIPSSEVVAGRITVRARAGQMEPWAFKWHAVPEQLLSSWRYRPRSAWLAQAQDGLKGTWVWGLSHFLGGLALLLGQRAPFTAGLGGQWFLWGAAHTALALHGLQEIPRQDAAEAKPASRRGQDPTGPYRRLLRFGTGLGIVTLLLGLILPGQKAGSRRHGVAVGLVGQGSFWLALGALLSALLRVRQD